jgi:hypothetical protein
MVWIPGGEFSMEQMIRPTALIFALLEATAMTRQRRTRRLQPASPAVEGGMRQSIAILAAIALSVLAACCGYLAFRGHSSNGSPLESPHPISENALNVEPPPVGFQATIENRAPSPGERSSGYG